MKKMKKLSATLLALLFVLTTVLPVQAANGPNIAVDNFSYIRIVKQLPEDNMEEEHKLTESYIYSGTGYSTTNVTGISYDKTSNTLTLTNFNEPNTRIIANEMGDDFKLKLVGTNSIQNIIVWGFYHGGSLQICGDGSLTINADKRETTPIILEAESSSAKLEIDSTVTLKVYNGETGDETTTSTPMISVRDTHVSSGGITFTGHDDLNAKVKCESSSTNRTDAVNMPFIRQLRKCTPKDNSGYDATASYGFYVSRNYINYVTDDYVYVITVYKIDELDGNSFGLPLTNSDGSVCYFTEDQFKTAFSFKGALDPFGAVRKAIYFIEDPEGDEKNMNQCVPSQGSNYDTAKTYTYVKYYKNLIIHRVFNFFKSICVFVCNDAHRACGIVLPTLKLPLYLYKPIPVI